MQISCNQMELNRKKNDSEIILTDMLKYCLFDVGFYRVFTKTCNIFTNELQYKDLGGIYKTTKMDKYFEFWTFIYMTNVVFWAV